MWLRTVTRIASTTSLQGPTLPLSFQTIAVVQPTSCPALHCSKSPWQPLPHPYPHLYPPEDVFVGLCARAAGVLPSHCPLFSGGPAVPYGRCCYQAMVSIHHIPPREMLHFWADIHSSPPCSWLSLRASLGMCKVRAMLGYALGLEQGL
ncbi:beta-1,3-galactosyltransferase 4-like protein [Lates japonicus]|uniref:Beta-1,3-galactosyltransferase 4-like protein n=1 Tax=Lates japonicus TaxID=270547 RepID=A0AAD3M2A1_LATJO|nr:beta-1,3-galactosyltransferase 4-like protein [Lates japonicus]